MRELETTPIIEPLARRPEYSGDALLNYLDALYLARSARDVE